MTAGGSLPKTGPQGPNKGLGVVVRVPQRPHSAVPAHPDMTQAANGYLISVSLGLPPVTLLGYPLTMVLAEKIVTAVGRGVANTRWRDFADVYVLARLHSVNAGDLRTSIATVAEYRKVALAPLLPTLAPMNERAQQKYGAWRTRSHRQGDLPAVFADVLSAVASFADPAMTATATGRWNPRLHVWE